MNEISTLAFQIASNQLASQKEDLRNLRNQATISAAITGLIATVFSSGLGQLSFIDFNNNPLFLGLSAKMLLVICSFSISILFAIKVVIDWQDVFFDHSPSWILDRQKEGLSDDAILIRLARESEGFFDRNESVISSARGNLSFSLMAGFTQIIFWVILIFSGV